MTMMKAGDEPLASIDAGGTIRFERVFLAPIGEVWRRITTEDGLASWFVPGTIDLRPGGAVVFHFSDTNQMNGTVLVCDPPHVLEYSWKETISEVTSRVRFELAERDGTTLMIFTHAGTLPGDRAGFGAGWHAGFHGLRVALAGETEENDTTYETVLPQYLELAPGANGSEAP